MPPRSTATSPTDTNPMATSHTATNPTDTSPTAIPQLDTTADTAVDTVVDITVVTMAPLDTVPLVTPPEIATKPSQFD